MSLTSAQAEMHEKIDSTVFAQIEAIMSSDYCDTSKMVFLVSVMKKREESVDQMDMMYEEARTNHM